MKIKNVSGYFDCRQYAKNVNRANRVMVAEGGRINFSVGFTDETLPAEIAQFSKKSEKSGINYVIFKVFPKNCKMYTASANLIDFPSNDKLDGGKFEVNMDISIKHGEGTELNGCYCNAIQVVRRADNPFDAVDGEDETFTEASDPFVTPAEVQPVPAQTAPTKTKTKTESEPLPF